MSEFGTEPNTKELPLLRYGVVGLGNAVRSLLPAFASSNTAVLAAGADTRSAARENFAEQYSAPVYRDLESMLRESDIDVVWIATPNPFHADHAVLAAEYGKHVVCEKPIALTLNECDRIIAAVEANGVRFLQGQCKLFQQPIKTMRELIAGGSLGNVVHVTAINFNDWLQRPRLEPEVDTNQGGGICYRQAPHHVDIVRYLATKEATSVRAIVNRADPHFPTEGNYNALIAFDGGVSASLVYNAYGYFDISELTWGIGEGGQVKPHGDGPELGPRRTGPVQPDELYGQGPRVGRNAAGPRHQPFYGLTIVGCERGVIRQSPEGIFVYDESGRKEIPCSPEASIGHEFAELSRAVAENRPAFPDAYWGAATLEVCLAMLESSARSVEMPLRRQSAVVLAEERGRSRVRSQIAAYEELMTKSKGK